MAIGEAVVGQRLMAVLFEQLSGLGQLHGLQLGDASIHLPGCRFSAFLGMDGCKRLRDYPALTLGDETEDVAVEMHHAALPLRLGIDLGGALHQATAGI